MAAHAVLPGYLVPARSADGERRMMRLSYTVLAFGLTFATATSGIAQTAQDPAPPPRTGQQFPSSGMEAPVTNEGTIDDGAVEALNEMSNYLMSAKTLALTSEATRDVVTNDGQRIQLEGMARYKIRRPGFVIDYTSDIKDRSFIYDGKTFTVSSPKLGFYASVPAPGTNKEVLDAIYNKFGIALPLEDLFRWGDGGNQDRVKALRSAYKVGSATVRGVETDHYAFREDNVDWEIWIQKADPPLPRKISIVDRNDPAKPGFTSFLTWQVNPAYTDADFTFVPGPNAKRIELATYKGE
jgi:hypothetical protein